MTQSSPDARDGEPHADSDAADAPLAHFVAFSFVTSSCSFDEPRSGGGSDTTMSARTTPFTCHAA